MAQRKTKSTHEYSFKPGQSPKRPSGRTTSFPGPAMSKKRKTNSRRKKPSLEGKIEGSGQRGFIGRAVVPKKPKKVSEKSGSSDGKKDDKPKSGESGKVMGARILAKRRDLRKLEYGIQSKAAHLRLSRKKRKQMTEELFDLMDNTEQMSLPF